MSARTDGAIVALVVTALLAVTGAVWLASGLQSNLTQRAADRQAAGGALLTAMLEQETGVRGFIGNGRDEFLTPYRSGRREFLRADRDSLRLSRDDRQGRSALAVVAGRARAWRRLALRAVAKVRRDGARTTTVQSALVRKAAMDRFRASQRSYVARLDAKRANDLAYARRLSVAIVLGLGLLFSAAGVLVVRWVRRVRAVKELRYQRLVRSLPDAGVLTFDHDLRFTSVDGSALEALGWADHDVLGARLEDLVAADRLALFEPRYRAALAGETERFEFDSDAAGHSWAVEVSPLRRDDGVVLGGLVMLRNITERRVAELHVERRTRDMEMLGTAA